jgi:DNA-directed RNA polymerase subunit L
MMELKTVKKDTNLLEIEFKGESFGFVNLIKEELWEDENVDEAVCIKEHPYMAEPKLYIKMRGKNTPEAALERVIKRIQVKVKDLRGEFERALKS